MLKISKIEKYGQTLGAAKESGLYDYNWFGKNDIDEKALQEGVESGLVQKDMLQAILDAGGISEENATFMKELVEQATRPGSLYVADIGLHERLDKIFPPANLGQVMPSTSDQVINAQRTAQIQQAGLRRGDASTAAPTIVNAPSNTVVDNKQSNTTNTTVSFSHPSPILNAVNVAA